MTDTPKRFCKDCKHLQRMFSVAMGWGILEFPGERIDPVLGETLDEVPARERNVKLDCELFEERPPQPPRGRRIKKEREPEPVQPKRAWWRFWE